MNTQKTPFAAAVSLLAFGLVCCQSVAAQDFPTKPAEETPLSPQAVQFLRGITLMLLPPTYSDDDDWGNTKRIQSGLNVKVDGLKVHTSRRWKDVNHGTWKRADAQLVDPKEHFHLEVAVLPRKKKDSPRYRISVSMRLQIVGRQQQWSLGAKLYSISANAVADIAMTADVEFQSKLVTKDDRARLQVLPHIETASVQLRGYRLNGISHAKGGGVRELGRAIEPIVQRAVRKKSQKLPAKINGKIQQKPERFQIPASILAFLKKKEADAEASQTPAAKPD